MMYVQFFKQETSFTFPGYQIAQVWLTKVVEAAGKKVKALNYIFCSDAYLHELNKRHLQHDTFTDVLAFDYSEGSEWIEGDIYISIPRVEANAKIFKVSFQEELGRVMVHGALHLLGYKDKTKLEKSKMRAKENVCLQMVVAQSFLKSCPDCQALLV